MIKIAICDDNARKTFYIESLLNKIVHSIYMHNNVVFDIEVFNSAESLIKAFDLYYFDLLLLDIEMNDINGIDAALHLRDNLNNHDTHIIYISGYDSYFMQLFDTKPSGFIKKPIDTNEFFNKVSNVIKKIVYWREQNNFNKLCIETKKETYYIPMQDIIFFESKARKVTVQTFKNKLSYYNKLNNLEKDLVNYNFIRTHQSYLVNLNHIFCIRSSEIICVNQKIIPISNKYRKKVHKDYLNMRDRIYE